MTTVEVCEICDIAECSHIRARRASTGGISHYAKAYQWAMPGWRAGPIGVACANASFEGILKQFVKPRQSTLRVRKIRWKGGTPNHEIHQCLSHMSRLGGLCDTTCAVHWETMGVVTTVTWPESKQ